MEIVIYAAGFGSRLGKNIPKSLVNMSGKMLLEYQLDAISKNFPEAAVHIMGGFKFDLLNQKIKDLNWKKNPIFTHYNPFYETGIISTAWESQLAISDPDILRIDGDVLITPEALSSLKNIKESTLLVTTPLYPKKTAVANIDKEECKNIFVQEKYFGSNEWIRIERYLNDDYRNIIRDTIHSIPLSAYYFEMVNKKLFEIKLKTKHVNNVFEINTISDLEACEMFIKNERIRNDK